MTIPTFGDTRSAFHAGKPLPMGWQQDPQAVAYMTPQEGTLCLEVPDFIQNVWTGQARIVGKIGERDVVYKVLTDEEVFDMLWVVAGMRRAIVAKSIPFNAISYIQRDRFGPSSKPPFNFNEDAMRDPDEHDIACFRSALEGHPRTSNLSPGWRLATLGHLQRAHLHQPLMPKHDLGYDERTSANRARGYCIACVVAPDPTVSILAHLSMLACHAHEKARDPESWFLDRLTNLPMDRGVGHTSYRGRDPSSQYVVSVPHLGPGLHVPTYVTRERGLGWSVQDDVRRLLEDLRNQATAHVPQAWRSSIGARFVEVMP